MTPPLATRLRLIALVIAAWLLPLTRAIRLLDYVIREDTGSINAANDIRFAQSLVVSYGFSLAVAVAVAWLMPARRTGLRILPPVASLLVAAHIVWLAPESVIVFFPTMRPFQPALLSLFIGGAGLLIAFLDHGTRANTGSRPSSPESTSQE